jgi:aminocyclitol acetyltransferase
MKTKLEQILERCLNGREVVLWGEPTRSLLRELKQNGRKFRIANDDETLDPKRHYVIAALKNEWQDFLAFDNIGGFEYPDDCLCYADPGGGELPFDWKYLVSSIGKWTYFGDGVLTAIKNGYIKSIGRFTSINSLAVVHVDHQFNMTFVSDEVVNLFSGEDRALFERELLADPKLPGTANKSHPLTIGADVWIGANAFINCSKVKAIGDGAIIGSGAVVLEDVPPYAIVVGVPAKVKRYRYTPEQIETLLRVKWWDWDDATINANAELLIYPKKFFERYK